MRKAGRRTSAHDVGDCIGGAVIDDSIRAKVRTKTCPLFQKRTDVDAIVRLWWHGFQPIIGSVGKSKITSMPL